MVWMNDITIKVLNECMVLQVKENDQKGIYESKTKNMDCDSLDSM